VNLTLPVLDLQLAVLIAVIFVAGVARGMAGFGSGMIVAPVAGAIYGPTAALVILFILDSLPTIPITVPAMKIARWNEVLPAFVGLLLLFPLGLYILVHGDVTTLRWLIALTIFASVAVIGFKYRYRGPRNLATSFSAGGVAGVLSGIAAIPGPPVITYWMASDYPAAIVRANLLSFFGLEALVAAVNLAVAGLFESRIVIAGLICAPFYFAGLTIGGRLFHRSSEQAYRAVTFALILLSAFLALPLFDRLFAGVGAALRSI
jgi:uncharacterized membrane protein YfcA